MSSSSSSSSTSTATIHNLKKIKEDLAKELPLDGTEDVERCRDMLRSLEEEERNINLHVLSETLIGTVVSKFKSHDALGPLAKSLVKKWKKLAASTSPPPPPPPASKKDDDEDGGEDDGGGEEDKDKNATKEIEKGGGGGGRQESVAEASKNNKRESLDRQDSNNNIISKSTPETEWEDLPPLRKNMCKKMHQVLEMSKKQLVKNGLNRDAVSQLCISRASEIEDELHSHLGKRDASSYTERARSLIFNMKKNASLRSNVLMGTTPANQLVRMNSDQLATTDVQQARQSEVQKLNDSRRLDWEQANEAKINEMCGIKGDLLSASLFTCGRCKSTKTTSTQKQTRSADEPMTVFVLCMNCGKRWKC